jgi:spore coat protein U-like protein
MLKALRVRILLSIMAAVGLSFGYATATTNQQVSVTGNVVGDCSTVPATGTLAFGSYNPFSSTDLTGGPFSFSINCTRGDTNLNVAVNGGLNFTHANPSGDRAMKDATNNFLTYQLYQTTGTGSPWAFNTTTGVGTQVSLTAGGTNSTNTISLYGIIPRGQTSGPDVGSYSDTVTVTVNY